MAVNPIYKHEDHNKQEIRNISFEKLASHPSVPDLFEGRFWQLTTDDHIYHYSGGQIRQVVNSEDLNKFGTFIGGHDASLGALPTQGSGVNEVGSPDLTIEKGDSWRITVAGTIVGLASGSDDLSVGDVLIALVDNASVAGDFMAIQVNVEDGILDEVQNFANFAAFPSTGELGVIYIANNTDNSYIWDGAAYKLISLPNIEHEATLGAFPITGDLDTFYVADDSNLVYFWNGVAYIPVSGVASNFYVVDGALTGNRTVSGGSNNLTYTGILGYTLSSATYSKVTTGTHTETVGGNKTEAVTGVHNQTSAGKTLTSTGAGNNITLVTHANGALVVPSSANPDGDIAAPLAGMIKYDSTDQEFRFYENGAWRTFGTHANIIHAANVAAFPLTGDPDIFYIADDTDLMYFWDGAVYQLANTNIYTGDGATTGVRTVTLGGNLIFNHGAAGVNGYVRMSSGGAFRNQTSIATNYFEYSNTSGLFLLNTDTHTTTGIRANNDGGANPTSSIEMLAGSNSRAYISIGATTTHLDFYTNNTGTAAGTIDASGNWSIGGIGAIANTSLTILGKGSTDATANTIWRNSTPIELMRVMDNGVLCIGTNTDATGVGTAKRVNAYAIVVNDYTINTVIDQSYQPTSNNSNTAVAEYVRLTKATAFNTLEIKATISHAKNDGTGNITYMYGHEGFAYSIGNASINSAFAYSARTQIQAGTVTNLGGVDVSFQESAAGTVTNMIGVLVRTPVNIGATTVTNSFGILLQGTTIATNNYGFVSASQNTNGFGTSTPNQNALAVFTSTTKAPIMLTPMTAIQASAITPANGMVVYVSDTDGTFATPGFWKYEEGAWVAW